MDRNIDQVIICSRIESLKKPSLFLSFISIKSQIIIGTTYTDHNYSSICHHYDARNSAKVVAQKERAG